ncbi:hypothetical protein FI667_g785, partial [Globisporangium splendens]
MSTRRSASAAARKAQKPSETTNAPAAAAPVQSLTAAGPVTSVDASEMQRDETVGTHDPAGMATTSSTTTGAPVYLTEVVSEHEKTRRSKRLRVVGPRVRVHAGGESMEQQMKTSPKDTNNAMPRDGVTMRGDGSLSANIEYLKQNFTSREANTNRLSFGMGGVLNKVESEMGALQMDYEDCANKNVSLIQEALHRFSYCSSQVDMLKRSGNITSIQVQNLRRECSREMDNLLLKLEDIQEGEQDERDQATARNLSTMSDIQRNKDEIELLKQEFHSYKRHLHEEPLPRGETDRNFAQRIEYFSAQLHDLYNEMAKLKQNLMQESNLNRAGIERLLTRQMDEFRDVQDDDTKRLQDEMDELRSELCDVLKEMHLLKERTKYLGPDCSKRSKRPRENNRYRQKNNRFGALMSGLPVDSESCSTCSSVHPGYARSLADLHQQQQDQNQDRHVRCDHPYHCHYHYPVVDTVRSDSEYAYPNTTNYRRGSLTSSQSSSPRRPGDVNMLPLQHEDVLPPPPEAKSCPSPHFSSRSSSISGRISVTRDEYGELLPEEEIERRLLEQHRLFWIKEGAAMASEGACKSHASLASSASCIRTYKQACQKG